MIMNPLDVQVFDFPSVFFQPLADFYVWDQVCIETLNSVCSKTLLFLHLALHVEYQGKRRSKER